MLLFPPPQKKQTKQDIILVAIGVAGYLAGAAAIATYADQWREFSNNNSQSALRATYQRVTNATTAAAVSLILIFMLI